MSEYWLWFLWGTVGLCVLAEIGCVGLVAYECWAHALKQKKRDAEWKAYLQAQETEDQGS